MEETVLDDTAKTGKREENPGKVILEKLTGDIPGTTQMLFFCLISTMLFGLVAHAFAFTNFTISHDSLSEFWLPYSEKHKIELGRFCAPLLRRLLGEWMVPVWLTGLTGLFFAGLAVYFLCRMFSLRRRWEVLVLSGLCVTNVSVFCLIATYVHDFSADMLALLLSVVAAYALSRMKAKFSWKITLLAAVAMTVMLGLYQSYLSVTLTLLVIKALYDLLCGEEAGRTVRRLCRALPAFFIACIAYIALVFLTTAITHIPLKGDSGNDLSLLWKEPLRIFPMFGKGYALLIQDFLVPNKTTAQAVFHSGATVICVGNGLLLLAAAAVTVQTFIREKRGTGQIALFTVLLLLLPLCMSCVMVVSTATHHLTRYAFTLLYLLILLVLRYGRQTQRPHRLPRLRQIVPCVMLFLVVASNTQLANLAYQKKELEREATLSVMTRVVDALEDHEGYVYGETPVAFIGIPSVYDPLPLSPLNGLIGLGVRDQLNASYQYRYKNYLRTVMGYDVKIASDTKVEKIKQTAAFEAMKPFPDKSCIAIIQGVIVVRMA